NTVYLIIMAFAHVLYKWLIGIFHKHVDGLTPASRLKRFIFCFVNIVAKFTHSGRRQIIHFASANNRLIEFANSS
ncbi:MAG: hypothetical protein ACK5L5_10665, partial [Bacteroidales bacterium]